MEKSNFEIFDPVQVRNVWTNQCLDSLSGNHGDHVGTTPCRRRHGNQVFYLTTEGVFRHYDNCLTPSLETTSGLVLSSCSTAELWTVVEVGSISCAHKNLKFLRQKSELSGRSWISNMNDIFVSYDIS